MVPFLVVISLFFPRILIFCLWIFSGWFQGVYQTWWWPVLGFLCMPHTMLWYSAVMVWYGGQWEFLQIFILVLSILADVGGGGIFKWLKD